MRRAKATFPRDVHELDHRMRRNQRDRRHSAPFELCPAARGDRSVASVHLMNRNPGLVHPLRQIGRQAPMKPSCRRPAAGSTRAEISHGRTGDPG
jgi:hypothetical protein